jgi:hypothetical protein
VKYVPWLVIAACFILLVVSYPHAAGFVLGIYPYPAGTPITYQLWSGFIPALAIVSVVFPFVNCHVESCMRIGRYPAAGGEYKVCRRHHPDHQVRHGSVTLEHILKRHAEFHGNES